MYWDQNSDPHPCTVSTLNHWSTSSTPEIMISMSSQICIKDVCFPFFVSLGLENDEGYFKAEALEKGLLPS